MEIMVRRRQTQRLTGTADSCVSMVATRRVDSDPWRRLDCGLLWISLSRFVVALRARSVTAPSWSACLSTVVASGQDPKPPHQTPPPHPVTPHRHPEGRNCKIRIAASPSSLAAGLKPFFFFSNPKVLRNGHRHDCQRERPACGGACDVPGRRRPSDWLDDDWQHCFADGELFILVRDGIGPDFTWTPSAE